MKKSIEDLTRKQRNKRSAILRTLTEAQGRLPFLKARAKSINADLAEVQNKHDLASQQLANFDAVHGLKE